MRSQVAQFCLLPLLTLFGGLLQAEVVDVTATVRAAGAGLYDTTGSSSGDSSYEIWCGGTSYEGRRPTAWTLEGSKTGEDGTWKTLDTQSGVTWASGERNKEFACETSEGCRHFRISFAASSNITLVEIKFNGRIYKPSGLMLMLR